MQFEAGRYILNEFGCMDGKRVQNFGKIWKHGVMKDRKTWTAICATSPGS